MGKQSPLRLLVETISNAVSAIEGQYEAAGLEFPSLDEPFNPTDPTTGLLFHPNVALNTSLLSAATGQLLAAIRPPTSVMMEHAISFHVSASLGTVSATNVPEILREAGPQGLHVNDIAKKNGMHPCKLARILRLLCTYHIFTEVKPDVFAQNRISSVIDTGKSSDELFSKPREEKYNDVGGIAAMLDLSTEEHFKTSAAMTDILTDPETSHTDDNTKTAYNKAYNTKDDFWTWLSKPGNECRNKRFIAAMDGASKFDMRDSILQGFPWGELPDGAKIVDVGGNVGSASIIVAAKYPTFKVVVQDLGHVVEHGTALWNEELPGSIESGRVQFQEHNFFSPQPIKDADVFLLRRIIHDWGSSYAITILRHLREAAVVGKTKLVMVDQVVQYACREQVDTGDIKMPDLPVAPEPMLPNFGTGAAVAYLLDVQMMTMFNGQERTLGSFVHDAGEAGWKITAVYAPPSSVFQHIVAEAV